MKAEEYRQEEMEQIAKEMQAEFDARSKEFEIEHAHELINRREPTHYEQIWNQGVQGKCQFCASEDFGIMVFEKPLVYCRNCLKTLGHFVKL